MQVAFLCTLFLSVFPFFHNATLKVRYVILCFLFGRVDSITSLCRQVFHIFFQRGSTVTDFIFRIHHSTYRRTDTASHRNIIIPLWSGWRIFMCRTRVIISRTSDCTSTSSDHTSCTNSPCNSAFHTSCPVSHEHHRSTEYPATYLLAVIGIQAEHTH